MPVADDHVHTLHGAPHERSVVPAEVLTEADHVMHRSDAAAVAKLCGETYEQRLEAEGIDDRDLVLADGGDDLGDLAPISVRSPHRYDGDVRPGLSELLQQREIMLIHSAHVHVRGLGEPEREVEQTQLRPRAAEPVDDE